MRKIGIILLCCLVAISTFAKTVEYVSDNTNFCNPERGFYYPVSQVLKDGIGTNLSEGTLASNRKACRTLILREYYLTNYATDSISNSALNVLLEDFDLCRKNGNKMIIRFAYTEDSNKTPFQDGKFEWWMIHLDQLKPILAQGEDVIACVQAGFLGVWGEWYYSYLGTGNSIPQEKKNALIDKLLECVPVSRAVQLRTPAYKTKYLGDSTPLTAEEAFTGTPKARLGQHNDAIMNGSDNMGTYSNRKRDMGYIHQDCLYLPNGGETDLTSDQANAAKIYEKYSTGAIADQELGFLHYSYLNISYSNYVISKWRQETLNGEAYIDILAKHFGYRFELLNTTMPSQVKPSDKLPVSISIKNIGYATPYNERHAYIVLLNAEHKYVLPLESDPRFWSPNSATTVIEEELNLPVDIAKGIYNAYIYLPDVSPALANNPEFAIRFANVDVWNEETGMNSLQMTVEVTDTIQEESKEEIPIPSDVISPVTDFAATASSSTVTLSWINPSSGSAPTKTQNVDLSNGYDKSYNNSVTHCSANLSYADDAIQVDYTTDSTWCWAGVEFPLDDPKDIISVSYEYMGNCGGTALIAYITDGEINWTVEGASPSLSAKNWTKASFTPTEPLWADPSHNFGDKPIIAVGFRANPANPSSGTFYIRNVVLTMSNGEVTEVGGVKIIRKKDSKPENLADGTIVYNGSGAICQDGDLEDGTYYYAAYAYDSEGIFAMPAYCSAFINPTGLDNIENTENKVVKYMVDGQIYIKSENGIFNILGQKVK